MTLKKLYIAATMVLAGTFSASASEIITDNYIGKGDSRDVIGDGHFDISQMTVTRSPAGIMTVRIDTSFVDINGTPHNSNHNGGGETYYYGDLFMSTTGWNPTGTAANQYANDDRTNTGTDWNYVYDLNGTRYDSGSFTDTNTAKLHELDNSGDIREGTVRENHNYLVENNGRGAQKNGYGSVEANQGGDFLEFIFDVSGTDLATAEQIAFHWTMSCANDVIQGLARFPTTTTPEPAALGLLGLGLFGMGYARRRKKAA